MVKLISVPLAEVCLRSEPACDPPGDAHALPDQLVLAGQELGDGEVVASRTVCTPAYIR